MFEFIKQLFITLASFSRSLPRMTIVSKFATCMSLNIQPCMAIPTLIDLNVDKYIQGLR